MFKNKAIKYEKKYKTKHKEIITNYTYYKNMESYTSFTISRLSQNSI